MLYVNVYLVTQVYGGPEEGGWYYDAGEPLASIPVQTQPIKGQSYYISSTEEGHGRRAKVMGIKVNPRQCDQCQGKGEYEEEDESYPEEGEPRTFMAHCPCCGELPENLEATAKTMVEMHTMFEEEAGRHQHISVSLQRHFAAPYPDRRPHYE